VEYNAAVVEKDDPDTASETSTSKKASKYRLPKLEFKRFGGDPKEWLSFWSQFTSIHEDEQMSCGEKFQYLIQATTEGSKAREVIESFPPTEQNYPKAISYLKERFGRDDVLVEVYVRDLLRLVLENTRRSEPSPVADIYDKLESQLRALETLGVTQDKYAAMLYPLVESSLPEETLRTWERVRNQSHEDGTQDRLGLLMKFLRGEVRGEERILLAKAGFGEQSTTVKDQHPQKPRQRKKSSETVPTATELLSGQRVTCIFCSKGHDSSECYQAIKKSKRTKW
jgi:hypothetical protein